MNHYSIILLHLSECAGKSVMISGAYRHFLYNRLLS